MQSFFDRIYKSHRLVLLFIVLSAVLGGYEFYLSIIRIVKESIDLSDYLFQHPILGHLVAASVALVIAIGLMLHLRGRVKDEEEKENRAKVREKEWNEFLAKLDIVLLKMAEHIQAGEPFDTDAEENNYSHFLDDLHKLKNHKFTDE